MTLVDPTLFESEWFVDLSVDERYMYLYLLVNASDKTGVFEWNERKINFCANTTRRFTKNDILSVYGNRIQAVPGHENTLIIVDYVRFNWLKGGRVFNPERNRLDCAIAKELGRYDLTIEKLNEMSKHKIKAVKTSEEEVCDSPSDEESGVTKHDLDEMFATFWNLYPGPRKQDKKKCLAKFAKVLGKDPDKAVSMFNRILSGIERWKKTDTWMKDGGAYICAPLVWLNNERWDAEVKEGTYGSARRCGTANANCQSTETDGLF